MAQTPRVCWLNPMVQKEVTLIFGSAYNSANASNLCSGTPDSLETYSTVYVLTNFAYSSKSIGVELPAVLPLFLAACSNGCSGRKP